MTQRSGFFNAKQSSGNYDRVYLASDFADYFASFIGNGVFAKHSEQLQVMPQESPAMSVQVLAGQAWINGYWYENTMPLTLDIDVADGTLDRVDAVVVRFNLMTRDVTIAVKKGTSSISATAPALSRTKDLYELKLANVNVPHGTVNIDAGKITDTRSNSEVCGWVTGVIDQMDTTTLYNQLEQATADAVEAMQDALDGTTVGNLQHYRRSLKVETEIRSGADLNTYQTAGNFGCSVVSNVATIANKPSGLADPFLLFVHAIGDSVFQEVVDLSGSRWCRTGISEWKQTYDSRQTIQVENGGTGATSGSSALSNLGIKSWLLDNVFKVGYVWVSYTPTSPASILGGSWTAITGRFPYFNAGNGTGGSNTHTLTAGQLANHRHWIGLDQDAYYGPSSTAGYTVHKSGNVSDQGYKTWAWSSGMGDMNGNEVSGQSHNNMPAYQTLYAWRRTS